MIVAVDPIINWNPFGKLTDPFRAVVVEMVGLPRKIKFPPVDIIVIKLDVGIIGLDTEVIE